MLHRLKFLSRAGKTVSARCTGDARIAIAIQQHGGFYCRPSSQAYLCLARGFAVTAEEPFITPVPTGILSEQDHDHVAKEENIGGLGQPVEESGRTIANTMRRLSRALRKGRLTDAERLLADIAHDDVQLNVKLCNYALNSCASAKDAKGTQALLDIMAKKDIALDEASYGCLLRAFCGAGLMDEAMEVLESLIQESQSQLGGLSKVKPNSIMFNTVLNGCANGKNRAMAERCLELMNMAGVAKDEITYTDLMKLEGFMRNEEGVEKWWRELCAANPAPNAFVHTAHVVAMSRTRHVVGAERALSEMIKGISDLEQSSAKSEQTVALSAPIIEDGVDQKGVNSTIPGFAAFRNQETKIDGTSEVARTCSDDEKEEARSIDDRRHDNVVDVNVSSDGSAWEMIGSGSSKSETGERTAMEGGSLLQHYDANGKLVDHRNVEADWLWWEGPLPELMSAETRRLLSQAYNSVINCAYHNGRTELAERFYAEMRKGGLEPDIYTYNALLRAVGRGRGLTDAKRLMKAIEMVGIRPDSHTISAMVDTLCDEGKLDEAESLLDRLHQRPCKPTCYAYNRVIDACTAKGDPRRALQIFSRMKEEGVTPDEYTYISLFTAFGRAHATGVVGGSWSRREVGRRVLALEDDMENTGVPHTCGTFAALVRALGNEGMVDAMMNRINAVEGMNDSSNRPFLVTLTCNVAINACVQAKQVDLAMHLFERMEGWGCQPDQVTYNTLINGCSFNKDMASAFHLMDTMKTNGISPDIISYNSLIKVTCHCGKLDLGLALLREMSLQGVVPDSFTFHTILSSATHHKRIDAIEFVVEHMHREGVKPDSVTCALLATAYLDLHRPDEVVESMKVLSARMIRWSSSNSFKDQQAVDQVVSEYDDAASNLETGDGDGDDDGDGMFGVSESCDRTRRLLEDAVMKGGPNAEGMYVARLAALLDGEYFSGGDLFSLEDSPWAVRLRKQYDLLAQSMSVRPKRNKR